MKGEYGPRVEGDVETFTVKIDDIAQLLTAAPRDILSDQPHAYMGQSVLERVLDHYQHEKGLLKKRHRLVLLMPPDKIAPGLAERCQAAMGRYADTAITDNRFRMAALRRNGLRQIPYSLVFLSACILLGILLGSEAVSAIPTWVSTVVSEGAFIVGWVALWGPVDTLLFARFPLIGENLALLALKGTELEIRPQGAT